MDVHLLGPVEVSLDGRALPLGATKQRAVLAMLALQPNAVVSVDRLADGLWGEEPPASAAKMVQLYVSQLRRLLAGADAEIITRGRGYELRVAADAVDAVRFERLVARAGRAAPDGEAREALGLWRGPALADVAEEPFAAAEIRRLDELRLRASELAVECELARGRHAEVLADLEPLIGEHPLRESLHAQRMLALYRAGRQADALDAYGAARRRLVDEIGVEPGQQLRELHARILRQDASLLLAPGAVATPPRAPAPAKREPAASRRRAPRQWWLVVGAAVALALAAGAYAVSRLTGPYRLSDIHAGAVGLIDAKSGAITSEYRLGGELGGAVAGGGSVWLASPNQGTVLRVRPAKNRVEVIDVGPGRAALAFGQGGLWVASEERGEIMRVDPKSDRILQRIPAVGNGLRAIAFGAGAVWAATALDNNVVRLDPTTGRVTKRIPVGGHPVALAVGAGAVWAAAEDAGVVVRVDPASNDSVDSIPVGNGPSAVTVAFGAVWTANQQDGTVTRIDPATDRVTATVPAGRVPVALTAAGGALWIADANGAVLKLDPRRPTVVAAVRTGSSPISLAAAGYDLWTSATAPPAAHRGGTLRVGERGGSIEMDPAVAGYFGGNNYRVPLAYEGLVASRRAGGAAGTRLVGALAVDVPKAVDGGRRYVFRLRPDLRYWDGTPVRAADIRPALERTLTVNGTDIPPLLDAIEGAAGCRARARSCSLARGVVGDDRTRTVTLRLRRPDPGLMEGLSTPVFSLVSPGPPGPREASAPLGTGPYRVERLVSGRSVTLVRNPYFRARGPEGQAPGFADRIEVTLGNTAGLAAAAAAGRLDLTLVDPSELPPARLAALRARLGTRLQSGPLPGTVYAWLNNRRPPFDDVRVRRAVNLAIDRARVVATLGGPELGSPTCQLLPPGLPGYRPVCTFTPSPSAAGVWKAPDLTEAKRLVATAGVRGTQVAMSTYQGFKPTARDIVRTLRQLGFRTRLRLIDPEREEMPSDPRHFPQVGLIGWGADSTDPASFLRTLISCSGYDAHAPAHGSNLSGFCDPRLDAAIDRAAAAGPADGAAWEQIEHRIARAAPLVPLYNGRVLFATSARTGNVELNPFRYFMLDRIWVR